MLNQGQVTRHFVTLTDLVGYPFGKKSGKGVFIEPHAVLCCRPSRQDTRRTKALAIDDAIVMLRPDMAQYAPQIGIFLLFFIPNDDFPKMGMGMEQRFVAFAQQKINGGIGIDVPDFFDQGRGQHHVAQEGSLNDKKCRVRHIFQLAAKVSGNIELG